MSTTVMERLLGIMAALRDPESGCPWDVSQTSASIARYTLEEAYEVVDAVERGDAEDLRDELGDLLLQVVFHARIAEESGLFGFEDVAAAITRKLIRRHPHVFDARGRPVPPEARTSDQAVVDAAWARIKAQERAEKAARSGRPGAAPAAEGVLGTVPVGAPALARAEAVSRRAAGFGFDWPDVTEVVAKVREEIAEVEESLAAGDRRAVEEEIGDLLFSVANLARHAGIDAEGALRRGTRKFERRFEAMARRLAEDGRALADSDLFAMEAAWRAVKRAEAADPAAPASARSDPPSAS